MEWLNTHIIYVTIILINIIIILYLLIDRKTIDDQKEILKTIINSSPDIIGYKDSKGKWVEVNKTLEEIINAKEPIIGKNDLDLMKLIPDREDEFRVCYETDKKNWENGNIKIVEEIFKLRDGTYQTFDVIKVPLYNIDGSRKGIGVIGRDITYKKIKEF